MRFGRLEAFNSVNIVDRERPIFLLKYQCVLNMYLMYFTVTGIFLIAINIVALTFIDFFKESHQISVKFTFETLVVVNWVSSSN